MDQSRPRRRLRSLLPRETGPRKPRRRSLARVEQEPQPDLDDADIVRDIWAGDARTPDEIADHYKWLASWGVPRQGDS